MSADKSLTHCNESNISKSPVSCNNANIWHMRLEHPNIAVLNQVLKSVSHVQKNKVDFCTACKYGKMHQFSFPASQNKTKKPFEIVYSDLYGPSPHLSTEGYR